MPITPEENVRFWQDVRRGLKEGARAGAEAMARYIAERAAYDTLQRTSHAVGEYWKAAPGAPPASASGNLPHRCTGPGRKGGCGLRRTWETRRGT